MKEKFDGRLKQTSLKKIDFDGKLRKFNGKTTSNKTKHVGVDKKVTDNVILTQN